MGVTAIKHIVNRSGSDVKVNNRENQGTSRSVSAGLDELCDIWVPWCKTLPDFLSNHYITIDSNGSSRFWIWQNEDRGVDLVRISNDGHFHVDAPGISGYANVNGDRRLIIDAAGVPMLERI